MFGLSAKLHRLAIKVAMAKPAPNLISRSGEEGRRADSFSVRLNLIGTDDLQILVKGISPNGVDGLCWSDDRFQMPCTVPNAKLAHFTLFAEHFYGLRSFVYNSPLSLVASEALFLPMIVAIWQNLRQAMFNTITPARTKRMDALLDIYDITLSTQSENTMHVSGDLAISATSLLHLKHGSWIWGHPQLKYRLRELTMVLDSLALTNDLKKMGTGYILAPMALKTLSDHEETKQRQRTTEVQTWMMLALTFVVAVATILQVIAAFRAPPLGN